MSDLTYDIEATSEYTRIYLTRNGETHCMDVSTDLPGAKDLAERILGARHVAIGAGARLAQIESELSNLSSSDRESRDALLIEALTLAINETPIAEQTANETRALWLARRYNS